MKKCLLIINPRAGQKKICGELVHVIDKLNRSGYQAKVFITSDKENAQFATSQLRDEELIVCAGGDGTLKQVVTGVIQQEKDVKIGYIPCGSTNDFATTLGLDKNIKGAIDRIVDGDVFQYDVGKFSGTTDDETISDNFVYVASFGLFSSTSYNTPQDAKNNLGALAYVFNGLTEIAQTHACHAKIRIDDEEIEGDYILGMVANTLSVGGVMKLNPVDVNLSDGLFEIVLIKKPKTLVEFNEILSGLSSKHFDGKMFVYKKASSASFIFDNDVRWSLDGEESMEARVFNVENIGTKLKMVK